MQSKAKLTQTKQHRPQACERYTKTRKVLAHQCTLSAKDQGATKNPVVDLGTNFDASTFYQDVSSVLSRSTEYSSQLFSSLPYFTQNMVDQKC